MTRTNRQWRLARRPIGTVSKADFEWREQPVPALEDGQILIRTIYLSLDPTNRIWMSDMAQYMPPVQIGEVMRGIGVGVVEESRNPGFSEGSIVSGGVGWQDFTISDGQGFSVLPRGVAPLDAFVSVLNHIGATAYFGLLDVARIKAGETVVVSAAAGAVGSLVGQIARIHGCRAIGIAGGKEKCRWLTEELGFDAAIDYKSEDVGKRLDALCPEGVDVNFESVGGDILDAVLPRMKLFGRVALCGLISGYNATEPPPGPRTFGLILMRRLRVEGFIVLDYIPRYPEALSKLGEWLATGKLKYRTELMHGLDNAPAALGKLFTGGNIGKLAVKVSDEP
jgi:NADPH-dependent curcumin reductase